MRNVDKCGIIFGIFFFYDRYLQLRVMLVDISGLYEEVCLHAAFANGESCGCFLGVALGNHGFVDHIGPVISHHSYWMKTVP